MTGLVARCCGEVLGGCVSLDLGYSCLRAWRATRGGEGDGIGEDGGLSSFCLATGVFSALLWLSCTAAEPAVCGIVSSTLRRPTPSFRLLRTGCWKARYVSLRERLRTGALTGDWRFRRQEVVTKRAAGVPPGGLAEAAHHRTRRGLLGKK